MFESGQCFWKVHDSGTSSGPSKPSKAGILQCAYWSAVPKTAVRDSLSTHDAKPPKLPLRPRPLDLSTSRTTHHLSSTTTQQKHANRIIHQLHQKKSAKIFKISAHHDFKAQISHLSRATLRHLPKLHGRVTIARHNHHLAHLTRSRPHVSDLAPLSHQSPIPLHHRRNVRQTNLPPEFQHPSAREVSGPSANDTSRRGGLFTACGEVRVVGVGESV